METRVSLGLQLPKGINLGKIARKPSSSLQFFQKYGEQCLYQMPSSCRLLAKKRFQGLVSLKLSGSSENHPGSL